mgnify:CR=1 FL=1|jgi:hypothetical protein|tara:strand:+ start:1083 stop:1310 length:228 start_codon:yes stop_codon:yes gene_type:complete
MTDEEGNLIQINKTPRKSPDLSKLKRIKIDKNTTIYVTPEKLEKFGEQHFIDLVQNRKKYVKVTAEETDTETTLI